jgi:general nucleoside transport system ATP-binding protein
VVTLHRAEPESDKPALVLNAITKRFGTTVALDGASLKVRRGTVHALLGENGAGKTTLMRIAFGLIAPDSGTLEVEGVARRFTTPREAIKAGIGMVHQHFMLVPAMTVAENIALGAPERYHPNEITERIRRVGAQHGLPIDPDAEVGTLSVGAQQRVEIVKALARDARIVILDEPTAVLPPTEARALLTTMRTFVAGGGAVILITHKLRDALEFADDVTVVRRGRTVYTGPASATTERALAAAMLGQAEGVMHTDLHDTVAPPPNVHGTPRAPVFVLKDCRITDSRGVVKLDHATLTVYAGEIVGIAAVEGNGQHELVRVLARRLPLESGTLEVPQDVGFVPEDRQHDALVLDFPLYENIALSGAGVRRGNIAWNAERDTTARLMEQYDVRAASPNARAQTLSGGNQQKLVIAREITAAPHALVVENPTRGLDVQATAAVHSRLRDASRRGTAVVLYSSDLDEVLAVAHRIVVLYNGTLFDVAHDRDAVGSAMVGRTSRHTT